MIIKRSIFRFFPRRIRHLFNLRIQSQIEGKPITAPLRMGMAIEGQWWRSWKTEAISRLCETADGAFIDIGANTGQTLIDHYIAGTKTRYIGFEPNPHCVYYITELIEANSLSQYTILPIGLAGETKIVPLYTQKGYPDDTSATLIADLRPAWELASQYVPCFKFDDVCQTLGLDSISLMKIDVEGFELEVLKGMQTTLKNLKPIILCEVLFADPYADHSFNEVRNKELMELLNGLDYKVFHLIKTADDAPITDAKRIEAFSSETFSEQNRPLCDYLFVPAGDEERVVNLLLKN